MYCKIKIKNQQRSSHCVHNKLDKGSKKIYDFVSKHDLVQTTIESIEVV